MTEVIVKLTGSGDWEVPAGVTELADVLVVGGGASGGRGGTSSGGGGGAGGVLHLSDVTVTPGELIAYSVGSGGDAVSVTSRGLMGQASVFGTHEALGGGWGGGGPFTGLNGPGGSGGSGGGGMAGATSIDAGNELGGDGEPGQGNDGGDGVLLSSIGNPQAVAGGGGGAGSAGQDSSGTTSGAGGAGIDLSGVFGTDVGDDGWFGGGGGGGGQAGSVLGLGGKGGGGDGGNASGAGNGMPGTGGGGGGKGEGGSSGEGGSGVILIRYFLPDPGTETGTGTGAQPQLTPLNLFLVSITLPDEPFAEPGPEPAIPDGGLTLSGNIQIPSDTQTGDLIMIFGFHRGSDIQLPNDFNLDYSHYRLGSGSNAAQTEFVFSKIANSSDSSREVNLSQFGVAVGNESVLLRMQAFAIVLRSSQPSYEVSILDRFDSLSHPSFNVAETGHLIGFCNAIIAPTTSQNVTVSVSGGWPNPTVVDPTPNIRLNCVTQPSPVTGDAYSWSTSPPDWAEARNGHVLVTSNGNAIDFVSSSAALILVSSAPE